MQAAYNHHGVMFSYYSAKTRAYMAHKRIPFVESLLPQNAERYRQATHKVMIPVVETPEGEILQDTTVIIDTLEERHPLPPVFPESPHLMLITRIVEFILDELWIVTAMHSRWNDPVSNAFAQSEMSRVFGGSRDLTGDDAKAVGEAIAGRMQSYLPMLGIADTEKHAQVDAFFESATLALDSAVGPSRYAFGGSPTLIDFCLFEAYYAHQYRDAGAAQAFLKTRTPDLAYFLDTLHAGCAETRGERFLREELVDYLGIIGPPGASFATAIMQATGELVENAEPGPFEKGLGMLDFDLLGPFSRGGSVFGAWKLQRAMDCYEPSGETDDLLRQIGWYDIMQQKPSYRLGREDHATVLLQS